jgi:hypothetical protein
LPPQARTSLDAQFGFLRAVRPARAALALDLQEDYLLYLAK